MNNQFGLLPKIVYHGTTSNDLKSLSSGINVNMPNANQQPDFGKGFYTTTNIEQASIQATRKSKYMNKQEERLFKNIVQKVYPVVVQYKVDIEKISNLSPINTSTPNLIFDSPDEKWGKFVLSNRTLSKSLSPLHNIDQTIHFVYGPLADGNPSMLILLDQIKKNEISLEEFIERIKPYQNGNKSQDQFSVHTNDAALCLIQNSVKVVTQHG
jgi:hypothetical protein